MHQAARLACTFLPRPCHSCFSLSVLDSCIHFKLAILMYKAIAVYLPSYLWAIVLPCISVQDICSRSVLSSVRTWWKVCYGIPLAFGRHSITVASSSIYISFLRYIHNPPTETILSSLGLLQFLMFSVAWTPCTLRNYVRRALSNSSYSVLFVCIYI